MNLFIEFGDKWPLPNSQANSVSCQTFMRAF
jgi:hypothetical protein